MMISTTTKIDTQGSASSCAGYFCPQKGHIQGTPRAVGTMDLHPRVLLPDEVFNRGWGRSRCRCPQTDLLVAPQSKTPGQGNKTLGLGSETPEKIM